LQRLPEQRFGTITLAAERGAFEDDARRLGGVH